jgi:Uma2 family endonuclease
METAERSVERKVILHNVRWETYERLLAEQESSSGPRFTYDRGELEIMSPSTEHEEYNRTVALLVEIFAAEVGLDVRNVGSMTFRREDLERGFEPDSCFYVQNEERVSGKPQIDLAVDPPPDLVIEVDITSPSLNKLPIYAQIGVPEVWRYDGGRIAILRLERTGYSDAPVSATLPSLSSSALSDLVEKNKAMKRSVWIREVREWVRSNVETSD